MWRMTGGLVKGLDWHKNEGRGERVKGDNGGVGMTDKKDEGEGMASPRTCADVDGRTYSGSRWMQGWQGQEGREVDGQTSF